MKTMIKKRTITGFFFVSLIASILSLSSNVWANENTEKNEAVTRIISKYYSLNGKYNTIKFKFKSSVFEKLATQATDSYFKNFVFIVELKKGNGIFVSVDNVPKNLNANQKDRTEKIISNMKRQIRGFFLGIAPIIGGLLDSEHSDIQDVSITSDGMIITDQLKNSNINDKLFFDKQDVLEKIETSQNNIIQSNIIPTLQEIANQYYITGMECNLIYPEKQTIKTKIKYQQYKDIALPYLIEYHSEFKGQTNDSFFVLEPIELE